MKTKTAKTPSPLALAAKKAKARQAKKDTKPAAPPKKSRRLEEIAESKKGLFAIDPRLLLEDDDFQLREDYGDIPALAESLFHNGLETPFKVRKEPGTERIFIVRGYRRKRAISLLITQGRWHNPDGSVKPVDCQPEAQGTTEFERMASQITSNSGLPYNLLEKASVYKRLLQLDTTLKPADLARRFGESKQAVSDALRLSNDGCHLLIENVRHGTVAASTAVQIIKQVGNETDAQEACFQSALATAHAAGRSHVMPKDLPASASPSSASSNDLWKILGEPTSDYGWNENHVATTPDVFQAKELPSAGLIGLEINTANHKGKWFGSHHYELKDAGTGGALPNRKRSPHATMQDAIRAEWDDFCENDLPQALHRNPKAESLIRHCIALGHDLSARFPTGTPWDESVLTKRLPSAPPEDSTGSTFIADPNDDKDEQDEQTDDETPPASMCFKLYVIDDTPEDPIADDSPFYHETDRLVLDHADLLPGDIGLLHLLSAGTPSGIAYGFRVGSYESLPDIGHIETLDTMPEEGFKDMLDKAIDHAANDRPDILTVRDELHALLADAIQRYYMQTPPEEPNHLTFVGTSQAAADHSGSNNPGFQKTLNSSGGGGNGGGGTGYAPPDKQMENIDKLLDDLADKGQGIEERVTTVDIVMGILRSERHVSDLKNYLTGK